MLKEQVSRVGTRVGLSGFGWFLSQVVEEPFDSGIDRWWFQICFYFTPTWGNDPNWLIFFRWVETTT